MTDRELLELAAKAAGIDLHQWVPDGGWSDESLGEAFQLTNFDSWNPLTDDGDALRLAVKLGMSVWAEFDDYGDRVREHAECGREPYPHCMEATSIDPYAATRRAIVHAAAEIGKEMK